MAEQVWERPYGPTNNPYLVRMIHGKKARPIQKDGTLQRVLSATQALEVQPGGTGLSVPVYSEPDGDLIIQTIIFPWQPTSDNDICLATTSGAGNPTGETQIIGTKAESL